MIGLAIKLFLGGWERLLSGLTALWGTIRQYPLQAALIASLCLSGWLWRGRQAARVAAAKWEIAFDKQKAAYELAQKEATRIATEAKAAQEAKDEQRRKDADNALAQDRAVDRRNAADYADSHRVRYKAAPSRGSTADLPESPAPAQVDNGPGAVAELDGIAVSREDFDRCTDNSRRLKNAHDWAVPGE